MDKIIKKFQEAYIIPVMTLNNIDEALRLSEILINNGLTTLEITLRTKNALKCIKAIIKEFPKANIGAGTILKEDQLKYIKDVGCSFAISPGFTPKLLKKAKKLNISYLPGASTPSEIMQLLEKNITFQKFFHATNSGAYKMLKTYNDIFPNVKFCPTGGISEDDFHNYLKLPNVVCVGGSWMVDTNKLTLKEIEKSLFSMKKKLQKL